MQAGTRSLLATGLLWVTFTDVIPVSSSCSIYRFTNNNFFQAFEDFCPNLGIVSSTQG